ncbi:hypothetical protein V8C42DRAFT_305984 [Trichoderma barbatum]
MSIYIHNATGETLYLFPGKNDLLDPPSEIDSGDSAELRYTPGKTAVCNYGDKKGSEIFVGVGSSVNGNEVLNVHGYVVGIEGFLENGKETFKITKE